MDVLSLFGINLLSNTEPILIKLHLVFSKSIHNKGCKCYINFYYFSHLSLYSAFFSSPVSLSFLLSFSFTGLTFFPLFFFLSIFFIHWHPQLKTTVVVVVLMFFFSSVVVVLVDCFGFFFFCLEVACDSDGGCFGWWCWFILIGFVVGCWWR